MKAGPQRDEVAEGATSLLGAAEGRDHIFIQLWSKSYPGVLFDNILTIFESLGEYFLSVFRGPPEILDFQYFDNFRIISPGPLRKGQKSIF